jgi:osmotically-inducible protein OsmY
MANSLSSATYSLRSQKGLLTVALCSLFLQACDPVSLVVLPTAVVAGAGADERGVGGVASDTKLRTKINYLWMQEEAVLMDRLTLSVLEGHVLLTGTVESQALKQRAIALTKSVKGVKKVNEHIRVGTPESLGDYSRDSWITTKLKTNLVCDGHVAARNYSIRTVARVIYLTGIAQNQQELNIVMNYAKNISGVKQVISYIRVKNPPAVGQMPGQPTDDEEDNM